MRYSFVFKVTNVCSVGFVHLLLQNIVISPFSTGFYPRGSFMYILLFGADVNLVRGRAVVLLFLLAFGYDCIL